MIRKRCYWFISAFSDFFTSHQPQLLFLLILFVVLNFLSELPYLNLILGKTFIFFLLWLVSIFLFKLSGRFSIKAALVLLCFCPFLLILKKEKLAEEIGNLVYGLLLTGVIQELITYLREEKSEKKA